MSSITALPAGPARPPILRTRVEKAQERLMMIAATLQCMRPLFDETAGSIEADLRLAMESIIERIEAVHMALDPDAFTRAAEHEYDEPVTEVAEQGGAA